MKAHVWVMPKRTVLDPQGQTIQHALSGLGYSAVRDVRQGDRKSTRLNSSHITISYAVFCLKKKSRIDGGGEARRSGAHDGNVINPVRVDRHHQPDAAGYLGLAFFF